MADYRRYYDVDRYPHTISAADVVSGTVDLRGESMVSALFGYSHDEIVGRNVEIPMPDRFHARHVAHREHYRSTVRASGRWSPPSFGT